MSALAISIIVEVLVRKKKKRQEKEKKCIQIQIAKEQVKLHLSADNMIFYVENSKKEGVINCVSCN